MGLLWVGPLALLLHAEPTSPYGGKTEISQKSNFSNAPTTLHKAFPPKNPLLNPKNFHGIISNCKADRSGTDKSSLLTNDNEYSRLRLGKNALNSFHLVPKFTQTRATHPNSDEFEALMDVGKALLEEGEQGLDGSLEVSVASRMLIEAAVRFAAASAVDPSSIDAVAAWGIALLAHGKLKLLFSRSLRDLLLQANSPRERSNAKDTVDALRDLIPKVCEESERLLVEAGRKLGKAALLKKDNDFALYNWGLSLFYRARLIAADGLEDAIEDADKLYLIAIERFKAASQLSKEYSGAAYLSWALALRDRFWLQGSNKRTIEMLEQAKWASQQALRAYPGGLQARLIARVCTEELAQFQMQ